MIKRFLVTNKRSTHILILLIAFIFLAAPSFAQKEVSLFPKNWWVGMKWNKLQIMLHGDSIGNATAFTVDYPGVVLKKVNKAENRNYVFLDLIISASAKPGIVRIVPHGLTRVKSLDLELRPRRKGNGVTYAQGVTAADLIYLIMPDRFSNGDPSNDKFADLRDSNCDRSNPFFRHGGDFQGIINHLGYFSELGVTALWLTPVIENNQPPTTESGTTRTSYHGYHFTNQYQIDKRFGGNEGYKKMIDGAHARGLKIIQDAVYNHIGNKHFLFLDPPSKDWFNQWPAYTNTSYKDQPLVDRYAAKRDFDITLKGWFTPFLPDLNQSNPFVANFLIQHALWSVEEFGIDGWRVDTYFYSEKDFLNAINQALYREYPAISIFGETTMQSVTEQAYYMENNLNLSWKSNLQGVTDYEWSNSALSALNENFGWAGGVNKLYNTLVQDILYKDPMRNEIFFDNHDQNRFYSMVGEDFDKYKMGIALLFTQRGIPQLYYGTEILMKNFKDPSDAEVRKDFPGGWKEDSVNKFIASGRSSLENEAFDYIKVLAQFRKASTALQSGRLMQYVPEDGLYVYFRYNDKQTVMCLMNTSQSEKEIDFSKYAERTGGFSKAFNIQSGDMQDTHLKKTIPGKTMWILDLRK